MGNNNPAAEDFDNVVANICTYRKLHKSHPKLRIQPCTRNTFFSLLPTVAPRRAARTSQVSKASLQAVAMLHERMASSTRAGGGEFRRGGEWSRAASCTRIVGQISKRPRNGSGDARDVDAAAIAASRHLCTCPQLFRAPDCLRRTSGRAPIYDHVQRVHRVANAAHTCARTMPSSDGAICSVLFPHASSEKHCNVCRKPSPWPPAPNSFRSRPRGLFRMCPNSCPASVLLDRCPTLNTHPGATLHS